MPESSDTLLRQWQMLRLIPRHPRKITTAELTLRLVDQSFSVTKRTVERDLATLSVNFPLVADKRSQPYGWSWAAGAIPLDVPALSPTEALSFLMMRQFLVPLMPASLLSQLAPYFSMAEQCLASLGERSAAKQWLKRVAMVPPTQALIPAKINADVQAVVQEALLTDRRVKVRYRKRDDSNTTDYELSPLGLVQRGGVMYLVATFFEYPDVRMLAMHRVQAAEKLDLSATRPKGFDLNAYIASGAFGFGGTEHIRVVIRFERSAGEHLWDTPLSTDQRIIERPDERLEVTATVVDAPQLRWWLLGFGSRVEVVEPQKLVNEMAKEFSSKKPGES